MTARLIAHSSWIGQDGFRPTDGDSVTTIAATQILDLLPAATTATPRLPPARARPGCRLCVQDNGSDPPQLTREFVRRGPPDRRAGAATTGCSSPGRRPARHTDPDARNARPVRCSLRVPRQPTPPRRRHHPAHHTLRPHRRPRLAPPAPRTPRSARRTPSGAAMIECSISRITGPTAIRRTPPPSTDLRPCWAREPHLPIRRRHHPARQSHLQRDDDRPITTGPPSIWPSHQPTEFRKIRWNIGAGTVRPDSTWCRSGPAGRPRRPGPGGPCSRSRAMPPSGKMSSRTWVAAGAGVQAGKRCGVSGGQRRRRQQVEPVRRVVQRAGPGVDAAQRRAAGRVALEVAGVQVGQLDHGRARPAGRCTQSLPSSRRRAVSQPSPIDAGQARAAACSAGVP